jgi:hypothetical protein
MTGTYLNKIRSECLRILPEPNLTKAANVITQTKPYAARNESPPPCWHINQLFFLWESDWIRRA